MAATSPANAAVEVNAQLVVHPTRAQARPSELASTRPGATGDWTALCRALRDQLAAALPGIMVPAQLVVLDALPRSPAGKLDRKALPVPEAPRRAAIVPPRDDLERRLVALWQDVLAVPALGIHDSFFDLGGHSLSATRLASRIRAELAIDVPLRTLFEAPSVAELAGVLRAGGHGAISDTAIDDMASFLDALEGSAPDLPHPPHHPDPEAPSPTTPSPTNRTK